ncbi:LTA synthase family protein [Crocinitomix catalasitica]|nr:LTA synthase family protein [Crocinitomix catalasitica]
MVYFTDFLAGIWFDLVTAAIVFLPLVLFEMFPNKRRGRPIFQKILAISFHLILFLSTFINLIDVEYFRHTSSRSTVGLFKMLGFGDDLWQQLPSFLADYWYLIIFAILFQLAGIWLYKRINRIKDDSEQTGWIKQIILFPIACGILVLIGRGGVGMKPIAPANAAAYTIDQNVQLVLNSAFTVIKTWGDITIDEKNYFSESELKKIFNPRKNYSREQPVLINPNIVILTLESFSVEYISEINGKEEVYTPFLDSLIRESLVYTNCYANGKKSMDAMPSIISSIPKLMEIEYLTSPYAANKIESIPKLLKSRYYSSGFFHGASNGSMNFDTFADVSGFDDYYGRDEYNNDDHYDGTWGIYDEEFYLWSIEQMDEMKKPFFSTVFSISSHPPYSIPERYQKRFNGGPSEMHNSIHYADYALSRFFNSVRKKEWYTNTLFIIVADHTPATSDQVYYKEQGNMHIPLVFHYPNHPKFKGRNDKIVSQVDIMPSIMHLIAYEHAFFSFGRSVFKKGNGFSTCQIGERQLYFGSLDDEDYLLMLANDEITSAFVLDDIFQLDNLVDKKDFKKLEDHFKAMIQMYNHALINNEMTIED